MQHFIRAFERGVPIVGLRTSTHAFQYPGGHPLSAWNKFGENVLGEEWVTHWGRHKEEATRGVVEASAKDHPILNNVKDIFGDTDVYEAYPPDDATILVRGQVLKGMKPNDPPAQYTKKRASDGREQDVNDPMMPVAWVRTYKIGQNEWMRLRQRAQAELGERFDIRQFHEILKEGIMPLEMLDRRVAAWTAKVKTRR